MPITKFKKNNVGLEKLDKFKGILEAINGAYVTEEQLLKVMDTFSKIFQTFKAEVMSRSNISEGVVSSMDKTVKDIDKTYRVISSRYYKDIEKLQKDIQNNFNTLQTKIGEVEVIKGEKGDTGDIKELSPDEIRDSLELLQGDERLEKSAIKGLEQDLEKIRKTASGRGIVGGSAVAGTVRFHDLSTSTDGSTKVFTVPKGRRAIVIGSDFPTILMEGNGFTLNANRTQLTLTVDNAPSTASQLLYQYVSFFN